MRQRKLRTATGATIGLCVFAVIASPQAGRAQDTTAAGTPSFPDIPANHWAYQYVKDLADKGYLKGYPDGSFLGTRALTRYEFASAIDRIVQTLEDVKNAPSTPTAPQVTPDDLNKIQVLVDTFQPQLEQIQSDVTEARKDILELRSEISNLNKGVDEAKTQAANAQKTADNSYGFGQGRKFAINGYVQFRYISVASNNNKEFPNGTNAAYQPVNGDYAKGGAGSSFVLRRSRLVFSGQVTPNTRYAIQFDTGAGTTNTATTKSAYVNYTFGNGNASNPSAMAGLIPTPFGYVIPQAASAVLSPERPLAFNEGTATGGPFSGQDYDRHK